MTNNRIVRMGLLVGALDTSVKDLKSELGWSDFTDIDELDTLDWLIRNIQDDAQAIRELYNTKFATKKTKRNIRPSPTS